MSSHLTENDGGIVVVLLVAPMLLLVISYLIYKIYTRKKSAAIEKIAKQKGWSFERKLSALPFGTDFSLFRRYNNKYGCGNRWEWKITNVLRNTQEGILEAVILEFRVFQTRRYGLPKGYKPHHFIVAHFKSPTFRFPAAAQSLPDGSFVEMEGNNFLCYREGSQNAASVDSFMHESFQTLNRFFATCK